MKPITGDVRVICSQVRHRTIRWALVLLFLAWAIGTAINVVYPPPMSIHLDGNSLEVPPVAAPPTDGKAL